MLRGWAIIKNAVGCKENRINYSFFFFFFFFFSLFAFSRAAPSAYGGSQTRDPVGAVAAGLHQSHSNVRSEPRLQPTPQLMAAPDL